MTSKGTDDLLQICSGEVKVPDRHSVVVSVIESSLEEIQLFTVCDVAPDSDEKVVVHAEGGDTTDPVGVVGLGISPSLSTGAWSAGSILKLPAVTGGSG
jgi:hypothetical protein